MTPDLALRGATVVTMDPAREVLEPGLVEIHDGVITRVEADRGQPTDATEVRHLDGRILVPGFVNAHAHLVSALTRGLGGDRFQTGGDPEGKRIAGAIRETLDAELCQAGTRLALSELIASGVTTTTDSQAARRGLESGSDGTLAALTESGMRAVWYRASVNRSQLVPEHRHDDPELAVSELDRLRERWSSDRIEVGAEAMALHRVTPELLETLSDWAHRHGAPFAMHLGYNRQAADYPVERYGTRLMSLLADRGILDHRFLGHHPVHVDRAEIAAIAEADAGVSVCSGANMLIGLAPAPLPELVEADLRVGLGTDQPNDGHDFFETMKTTILQQRAAARSTEFGTPSLALELATIGGARALHLEHEIGSVEVGKRADLVVLDASRPALNPAPGRLSNLVYAAGPGEVESVLVDGREIFADGRPTAWDPVEVVETTNRLVEEALAAQQH